MSMIKRKKGMSYSSIEEYLDDIDHLPKKEWLQKMDDFQDTVALEKSIESGRVYEKYLQDKSKKEEFICFNKNNKIKFCYVYGETDDAIKEKDLSSGVPYVEGGFRIERVSDNMLILTSKSREIKIAVFLETFSRGEEIFI